VCRNTYDVLTGNKIGPTVKSVQDLIGNPPTDTYVGIGQYNNSNGTFDTSRALVLAPIMDLTAVPNFCPPPLGTCTTKCEQFPSGSNVSIQVIGFALIFIENANGGNVTGRLVNVLPCGPNTPSADDYGSVAVPLRLIHK